MEDNAKDNQRKNCYKKDCHKCDDNVDNESEDKMMKGFANKY